jgi:hypothetical protein
MRKFIRHSKYNSSEQDGNNEKEGSERRENVCRVGKRWGGGGGVGLRKFAEPSTHLTLPPPTLKRRLQQTASYDNIDENGKATFSSCRY